MFSTMINPTALNIYGYFRAVEYCSQTDEWVNKSRFKKMIYSYAKSGFCPNRFVMIANMINLGHFSMFEYQCFVIDCFIQGNGKCIVQEQIDGQYIQKNFFSWYSKKRLEIDQESFIIMHREVKEQRTDFKAKNYIQYRNFIDKKHINNFSLLFTLVDKKMFSPIFYLTFLIRFKVKPQYEKLDLVGDEEYFRKMLMLLNHTTKKQIK
jgi:hypothetical protein